MGLPAANGVVAAGLPPLGDQASAVLSGVMTAVGPTAPFAFRGPMNLSLWSSITATLTTTAGSLAATVNSATGLAAGNAIKSKNVPPGTTIGVLSGTNVTLAPPPVTYHASGVVTNSQNVTLPPGSNVAQLLNAAVTVPSTAGSSSLPPGAGNTSTLPSGTTVSAIVQVDVAATNTSPGVPGIITLSNPFSAAPTNNSSVPLQFAPTGNVITLGGADAAATFTGAAIEWTGTVNLEKSYDGGNTWIVGSIALSGTLAQFATGTPVSITFGEPEKWVLYRLNAISFSGNNINYRISQTGGANEVVNVGPLSNG